MYFPDQIEYSSKFRDDVYEYRNVTLPQNIYFEIYQILKERLLTEEEWRYLGVQGSKGYEHYERYFKELHILMMRKRLDYDQTHNTSSAVQQQNLTSQQETSNEATHKYESLNKNVQDLDNILSNTQQSNGNSSINQKENSKILSQYCQNSQANDKKNSQEALDNLKEFESNENFQDLDDDQEFNFIQNEPQSQFTNYYS